MTIIPLLIFVVGWGHVQSTWQWSNWEEKEAGDIKVINYNLRNFSVLIDEKSGRGARDDGAFQLLKWLVEQQADILCLQEYFNDNNSEAFDTEEYIMRNGYDFVYRMRGLATYSKYPIINSGSINYPIPRDNKTTFVDLKINADTIRIFNVHLYSMKVSMYGLREESNLWKENFYKIRGGFQAHAVEVEVLEDLILESPYPVIIAGDFNELPYGYSYITFKEFLQNSFEEKGKGFGFTYAHRPSFIRIDHQFSSPDLRVKSHNVHNDVTYSDHFPVSVVYQLDGNDKQK